MIYMQVHDIEAFHSRIVLEQIFRWSRLETIPYKQGVDFPCSLPECHDRMTSGVDHGSSAALQVTP
jgi:hypothetical protein